MPPLLLGGCVSFPIPPTGDEIGKYGSIEIKISYVPNYNMVVDKVLGKEENSTLKDK